MLRPRDGLRGRRASTRSFSSTWIPAPQANTPTRNARPTVAVTNVIGGFRASGRIACHACPSVPSISARFSGGRLTLWARQVLNLRPLACEASGSMRCAPWTLCTSGASEARKYRLGRTRAGGDRRAIVAWRREEALSLADETANGALASRRCRECLGPSSRRGATIEGGLIEPHLSRSPKFGSTELVLGDEIVLDVDIRVIYAVGTGLPGVDIGSAVDQIIT